MNLRSDVSAKQYYCEELKKNGFEEVKIVSKPADIIAKKNGVTYYFEIKMTANSKRYFGAATFTEWEQALKTPERYKFVIAIQKENNFEFIEYSPEEFMKFSTIPPIKVYFNIDFSKVKSKTSNRQNPAIPMSEQNFQILSEAYGKVKNNH